MTHIVKILEIKDVTHDVKSFRVEKPSGYQFEPGQATEVSINKKGLEDEKRPFTFTSLNDDKDLEFTIKIYDDHQGVTHELGKLKSGDELVIRDVWGAIKYKGPGYFIAGGAGVTPFIAIFRQLKKNGALDGNYLIFSNKTRKDIILHEEFSSMLGDRFINTLTDENHPDFYNRMIDKDFLKSVVKDFNANFYVCGPPKMVEDINGYLEEFDVETDRLIFEE